MRLRSVACRSWVCGWPLRSRSLGIDCTTPRSVSTPQYLLFPYVTNVQSPTVFYTGLTFADTSLDPLGTAAVAGSCTLQFYGTSPPETQTVGLNAGMVTPFSYGVADAGFQGYAIAACTFPDAEAIGVISTPQALLSVDPELLAVPGSTANGALLFSSVTNQQNLDTSMAIANTSLDPAGTAPVDGPCTLNFYGSSALAPITTGTITAGLIYTAALSSIASWVPGVRGGGLQVSRRPRMGLHRTSRSDR
jgi:hypothetical protein